MGRMTPWGEIPDNAYSQPALSFADFVNKYLNKIRPGTTLVWKLDEIAAATGAGNALVAEYHKYAFGEQYDAVTAGKTLTDDELIAHWTADHPVVSKPSKPFMEMTLVELQQLYNRL